MALRIHTRMSVVAFCTTFLHVHTRTVVINVSTLSVELALYTTASANLPRLFVQRRVRRLTTEAISQECTAVSIG